MCGRVDYPRADIIIQKTGLEYKAPELFTGNINAKPTDPVPVIANDHPNELQLFKWSLIPWYTKPHPVTGKPLLKATTFNATYERLEDPKSMWSKLFGKYHCVIITTGFYEWQWKDEKGKEKQPYWITSNDDDFTYIAGLWGRWIPKEGPTSGEITYSCTAITHPANEMMAKIHNHGKRMPAFIRKEDIPIWLDNNLSKEERKKVIQPVGNDFLRAKPVNNVGDVDEYNDVLFW